MSDRLLSLRAVDEARRTATITAVVVAGLVPLLWWIAR